MKYIAIALLCLTKISGSAHAAPQEIRVQLDTQTALKPIYISHIISTNSAFSAEYLKDLEAVVAFDFNYNGKTSVAEKKKEKELLLQTQETKPSSLQSLGTSFAISFFLQEKKLSCKVYNLLEGGGKAFPEIPLTGVLSQDRQTLHKLSDTIHKILFQEEGICHSRILYSYQSGSSSDWDAEIIECDWDGGNRKVISKEKGYCVTPVLIPKSKGWNRDLYLYVSYKTGQPKIFISSLQEGKGKKVVDIRGNQILPAISRNRDKIAFICDASGRTDLFIQSIEPDTGKTSTPQQLFSYPRSTQASPTFSPDGSKIAFVSDKDGAARIYWISSEVTNKRPPAHLITKKSRESSCPSWSPDGTKLAYSAKTNGVRQIWIYDFTEGEEIQLTTGPGNKENPCWANNSLHLVFNSTDGNSSDLYVVNLNQPEAVKITKGPGKKHYPTWGSR